ncbi:MAG: hypothetical protein A2131_02425 [Candidatus Sungbacteria bacterium GWC2_49_10]|uniref:HAD family hydrolase n=1 Tax=Candidatus Sungbacteria bacterium GWC2_49_10 TaxID=1802263 RepID=A0A1G2K7P5_9BACT|nr:MAG: hypothetical protein A2131_02425 [Candidatus Sungbacteria bacterium GWC2_49_10]
MTKAIIFDFYGVICNDIGSLWYKTKAPVEVVPELKRKYDAPSDTGEISEEEFFEGISKAVDSTGEIVRKKWLDTAFVNQELIDLISELKRQYKIALCSNATSKILRELILKNNLEKLFNIIVISSEVRMVKPNPDFFNYSLVQLGVSAPEAVFIDDREANIQEAVAIGIPSILYKDVRSLRNDLRLVLK